MFLKSIPVVSAALLLLLIPSVCQVKSVSVRKGELAERVDLHLTQLTNQGFSGALIIEKNGEVILKGGYGYSNRERLIPFSENTISSLGSVTKPLTATAILKLQEAGKLELNDKIIDFIPDLKQEIGNLTIHQLMLHTSGLGSIMVNNDFKEISREQFVQKLNDQKLKFPPGSERRYSNIGYSVLAYIIEVASGQNYEEYLQKELLEPLGMKHSGYVKYDWSQDSVATGYKGKKEWGSVHGRIKNMEGDFWNLIGNGGIHSNINDIYSWYRGMQQNGPISMSIQNRMVTTYRKCAPNSVTCFQGYGWLVLKRLEDQQPRIITHSGGNDIIYADVWWFIQENIFIAMLTNNSKFPAEDVLVPIRRMVRD